MPSLFKERLTTVLQFIIMNIFFDARWTRIGTHDGVSRYGSELVAALAKIHPVTMIIWDKRQLALLPKDIPYVVFNNPNSLAELFVARKLNKLKADVVFSPLQIMGSWGRRYKLILTLQDLIYYRHPKPPTFLPTPIRLVWWLFHQAYWPQRLLLAQADYVTTVSKTSKRLIEAHKLTKRPIGVIYNAPPLLKRSRTSSIQKELVYMGSFMPYKNVELLLKALSLLPEYKLHLASRITPERRAALEKLIDDPRQVVFWNGASDIEYADMLSRAMALVSASKDEGFGLPLIEAMAFGTPVVCSDMEIFHEVAGDGALFFNPDSPKELAACIRRLEDSQFRRRLIKKATTQTQQFSWENSARALLEIMKQLG